MEKMQKQPQYETSRNWRIYRTPLTLSIVGALVLLLAVVLPLVFPSLFEKMLAQKLVIRPDSDMLKNYKKIPIPIYWKVYFFNLTNSAEVLRGAKPKLDELGPYTYRMQKERVDIKFNHSIGTISSKEKTFYYFEHEMSVGSESDSITTLDLVYMSLASKVSADNVPTIFKSLIGLWQMRFDDMNPFMTHTVGEMLFQGFDAPVVKALYPATKKESHKTGKSGFMFLRNGTAGSEIEIVSGELGMDNYQNLVKYEGKDILSYWKKKRCNQLNGTTGSQFAKPILKSKKLFLFSPSLCRSIYLLYEKDTTLGPIKLHRFILPSNLLEKSDENDCYCSSDFTCRDSMVDCSPCKGGTPIVISTAHFYGGNREDIEAVEGIKPVKEKHETLLDIEPNTGLTMRVHKRTQVNMPFRRFAELPALVNITEVIFPILWTDETTEIPLDRVNKLHSMISTPAFVVKFCSLALLGLGLCLVFAAVFLTRRAMKLQALRKRRQNLADKLFTVQTTKLLNGKNLPT